MHANLADVAHDVGQLGAHDRQLRLGRRRRRVSLRRHAWISRSQPCRSNSFIAAVFYCKIDASAKCADVHAGAGDGGNFDTPSLRRRATLASRATAARPPARRLQPSCDRASVSSATLVARRQVGHSSGARRGARRSVAPARRALADRWALVAAAVAGAGARRHAAPEALARLGQRAGSSASPPPRRRRRRCSPRAALWRPRRRARLRLVRPRARPPACAWTSPRT